MEGRNIEQKGKVNMALIKTGTTVANVAASQKRVDELAKLAEGGLVIGLNVAS